MLTRLRAVWASINASYWFYPAVFAILAAILAQVTIWADRTGQTAFLSEHAWLELARPQGASNMLTVISGSMIGVASTVFSITIAAVAYASGNYGPRLLTNFMEDRGNQFSLATFIATFVYSLTVLGAVRFADERPVLGLDNADTASGFVPQLSLLVGYGLMGLSVAVLVFFLNHIPASIRINTVLQGIGKRLIAHIERNYPNANDGQFEMQSPSGKPVCVHGTGYIQVINYEKLERIAARENDTLKLAVRTGDFVHPDLTVVYWAGDDPPDDCGDEIRGCFALGGMRTPSQDIHFLIDELVEIGLRALSPGINDPFTAITALHWLGAATALMGTRDLTRTFGGARDANEDRLVLLDDGFAHYLARGFGTMRSAVATSPAAASVAFHALRDMSTLIDDESRHEDIMREGRRLMEQAREHLTGPSLQDLDARYAMFVKEMRGA